MRARYLAVAMLGLVVAVATDACSGDAGRRATDATGSVGGAITVQVSGEREETAVYRAITTAFENDVPSVDVTLVEIAEKDDHLAKLSTSFAAGDPPDVFLVNFREYSQFVERGAIEPIAGHLEGAGIDPAEYYEAPLEAFTFDGTLQCFPQNISSLVVYINTALFREAGVDPPFGGWGWDEFEATARKLTGGDVHGLGIEPNIIRIAPFAWSNGGEIIDDEDEPTRFTLEDPGTKEALEFIAGMVEAGYVPNENDVAAQDLESRFSAGKLGMLLSSRRDTPAFREVAELDFDVLPLPVADEPVGILHSDAYCIASQSDNVEAAARFVGFAVGNQGETLAALGGRTVPSMIAVANSPAFLDPTQEPEHSQVFLDGIVNLRRTPVIPTWPEIEDLTSEILTRFFYEPGYTVERAAEELDAVAGPLFQEGTS